MKELYSRKEVILQKIIIAAVFFVIAGLFAVSAYAPQSRAAAGEKFAAVYNVKKKPFKAKSGKDATAAIQKALDKAAKKGKADKRAQVYIPKGTYYITRTLQIGSNTYLKCDKNAKLIKKNPKGKKVLYMLRSHKKYKKGYNALKNVTVEGGIWDAKFLKYNNKTGGSLFFFVHSTNLEFTNVTLRNNLGTHLLELGGTKDVHISGCKFYGFKKSANNDDKEAIQLDVCHNYAVLPDGKPYDDTPCMNVVIENCEIYDYPRAIGSHTYVKGIYPQNITIKNNYIHNISQNAIYGYNYLNMSVTDNRFENVYAGVVFRSFSSEGQETIFNRNKGVKAMSIPAFGYNLVIANNTISTTSKSLSGNTMQLGMFIYGTPEYPITGASITNNTIKSASTGMYLRYVNSGTITGNSCTRNNNSDGGKFLVDAYKFLTCSNSSIQNNGVNADGANKYDNGFAFRESSKSNILSANTVNNVGKHGIGLYNGSSADITGNTVTGAGQHGLTLVDNSSAAIDSNSISGCTDNGITLVGSKAGRINGNMITGNGTGLSIQSSSNVAEIKNNTINSSAGKAMAINGSAVPVISNNNMSDNGTGISIQGGSTVSELKDNTIAASAEKSIAINSSTVTMVSGNTMSTKGTEWELTATSSTTNVTSFRPMTCDNITSSSSAITGKCYYGMKVYAIVNGTAMTGQVNDDGSFIIYMMVPLSAGTQVIVNQEDAAGNKGTLTKIVQ